MSKEKPKKRAAQKKTGQSGPRKRQGRKQAKPAEVGLPVVRPDTAGIDVGSMELFVAVSPERAEDNVRSFGSFTADLEALRQWLLDCGVTSVAMESTGVYWIPVYQMLADVGIEVCLVNARHFKTVPGRKTDVQDCQWLQYLHAVGLLRASFRPGQQVCAMRSLLRHRQNLIQMGSQHVLHMQKSMEQMNLKLHHVISDITGVSGLRIVEAIVRGERDPRVLAELRTGTIQAAEEVIIKSLEGDYRAEHLITLRQSMEGYRFCQQQMRDLDDSIEAFMDELPAKIDLSEHPLPVNVQKSRRHHNAPAYDVREQCYRAFGVDVTSIPGIGGPTAQVLLAEIGPDLSKFRSASSFASWLTLCPHNDVSGGKILQAKTRKGSNRATVAFRLAAQTLERTENGLGQFFRRMRSKLGRAEAITAVAHKLARIFYAMVKTGMSYEESQHERSDAQQRARQEAKLRKLAQGLGLTVVPAQAV
jgi:transposase